MHWNLHHTAIYYLPFAERRKNKCIFMPAHTKNIKRHAIALSFAKKKGVIIRKVSILLFQLS